MSAQTRMERFKISGVDCPNCAAKIETELRKVGGLEGTTMDFASGAIFFNPEKKADVDEVLHRIEPDARMARFDEARRDETVKSGPDRTLLRLLGSGVFFAAGILASGVFAAPQWVLWILFPLSYAAAGYPVVFGAVKNIFSGRLMDELFLMTLASAGAMVIGELPEAAAVMLFYSVGEYLQDLAVAKSRRSIKDTMALKAEFARVLEGNSVWLTAPGDVAVGTRIEILPGDFVPLDGVVVSGESWVDTSALTGESVPRRLEAGDEALAGFVNDEGRLILEVIHSFENSAISLVKKLLDEASSRKSPTERILSRFASVYTPVVVGLAALLAVSAPFVPGWSFSDSVYKAMILLVISCPCALVLSVPLAYFAGIGRASRDKILLRGADVLDASAGLSTVVFDKTGTLTEGRFLVRAVEPAGEWDSDAVLKTAAEVLSSSNHPIARSVCAAWEGVLEHAPDSVRETRGRGVTAVLAGRTVLAGNADLLLAEGIEVAVPKEEGSVVHLAVEGAYAGCILLSDSVKAGSAQAVAGLKSLGIRRTLMLTGDRQERAARISDRLGLDDYRAELLPDEKMSILETEMGQVGDKAKVAFVGDGLNDAPAILRADVGMAMGGSGTDLAIESADVVFMDDNPMRIPMLLKTSRFTRRIVLENIVFALVVKVGLMASGVFAGLPMWVAILGDVGVSLLAVLNSLRVLRFRTGPDG